MFAVRATAIACDLAILLFSVLTLGQAPTPLPNLAQQLATLAFLAGVGSLLFLLPWFRQGRAAAALATAKTLVLCLLVFTVPGPGTEFVPLWSTHAAVLVFHLELKTFLVQAAVFVALVGIFLGSFPPLAARWGSDGAALSLSAVSGVAVTGLLVLARVQARQLLDARSQLRAFERDLERLTEANVGFQEYSSLIEEHTLRAERDRISREIHDSTGYALTTLKMIFEAAKGC